MAAMFSMQWDEASLKEIARMIGMAQEMQVDIQRAFDKAGALLVHEARANMDWKNPTGQLAASMTWQQAPYAVEIGSPLIYSRRREFGFSGMVDSLGRLYTNDPGAHFLNDALIARTPDILGFIQDSIDASLMGGTP